MSARTAARRRRQYKLGQRGLAQIYGERHAPSYPGVVSRDKSQQLLAAKLATLRRIQMGGKK